MTVEKKLLHHCQSVLKFREKVNCDIKTKGVLFVPCSKLVISVTEHLVEVVDKLSTTVLSSSGLKGYWNASAYMGPKIPTLLQRLPAYYKIQPTEWEIYIKLCFLLLGNPRIYWLYITAVLGVLLCMVVVIPDVQQCTALRPQLCEVYIWVLGSAQTSA